jgi:GNAT superfamily N-acetyltransferase
VDVTIRRAGPADAETLTALANLLEAAGFATVEAFRRTLETDWPAGTERLVAEVDGEVAALGRCRVTAERGGWAWVGVLPRHRGHGLGSALYERLEQVLREHGAPIVRATVEESAGGAFARSRGFAVANEMRQQALDLRSAELPPAPAGVRTLREAGAWSIRELYAQAMADIPGQTARPPITDEEFRRQVAESAIVDPDASVVLLEEGVPVAFAIVVGSREAGRAGAQMTGVRADRRGRGLAQAVKIASLRGARAAGFETMLAANDVGNDAMLAVNRKLGFEPTVVVAQYEKRL